MFQKKIAIVIVSFNTRELVRRCLNSVFAQADSDTYEVHVVDNASSDGSVDMLKKGFPAVRTHENKENLGFSKACNMGWRASKSDVVLFLNGDVMLPPGSVAGLLQCLQNHPRMGIVSPELRGEKKELQQMTWGWDISLLGEMLNKILSPKSLMFFPFLRSVVGFLQRKERVVPAVVGPCIMVRRRALEDINGFDENFELYFEDFDLCRRVRQAGYDIFFTPAVRVIHGLGQSTKPGSKKIALIYRQSQVYYYQKHRSKLEQFLLKAYLAVKAPPPKHPVLLRDNFSL